MISLPAYSRPVRPCPLLPWARIHKWVGIVMFGLACFGAGNVVSTTYFKVPQLWQKPTTLQRVEMHEIPMLKARAQAHGAHTKTQGPDHPARD